MNKIQPNAIEKENKTKITTTGLLHIAIRRRMSSEAEEEEEEVSGSTPRGALQCYNMHK